MKARVVSVVALGVSVRLVATVPALAADMPAIPTYELSSRAVSAGGLDQLTAGTRSAVMVWEPTVNKERPQKQATGLYASSAPAVVVIRTRAGHGTGFLMGDQGWIVTNHHVISNASICLENARRMVTVYFGRVKNGLMEIDKTGFTAFVYASDKRRDLALLELSEKPEFLDSVAPLNPARRVPKPGDSCTAIGHPASGMLWTIRQGEVSGVGTWPNAHIDTVIASLVKADARGSSSASNIPKRKVILSSCPVNPGDSGGPLLDKSGDIVGVTFGIPKNKNADYSSDKFSYHVHVDELVEFMKSKPAHAEVVVPSTFAHARISELIDTDEDDRWDTWLMGTERGKASIGYMIDLDQDSKRTFKEHYIDDPKQRSQWDYEFALTKVGSMRTFYDRDNDGQTDLVLTDVDDDSVSDISIAFKDGSWRLDPRDAQPMIDPRLFQDADISRRFTERFAQH